MHQPECCVQASLCHPSHHFHDTLFLCAFDHRSNQELWPDQEPTATTASARLLFFAKCSPNTVGVGGPAVSQDEQRSKRLATGFDQGHELIGQMTITRQAHDSAQPQARLDHLCHGYPRDLLAAFHTNFIGLNVLQIYLLLHNECVMDAV